MTVVDFPFRVGLNHRRSNVFIQLSGPTKYLFPALGSGLKLQMWLPEPVDVSAGKKFALVLRTHDPGTGALPNLGAVAKVTGIAGALWPEPSDPRTFQDDAAGSSTGIIASTDVITSSTLCGELVRSAGFTEPLAPALRVGVQVHADGAAYAGGSLYLSIGVLVFDQ